MIEFNRKAQRNVPIERNSLFFSKDAYDFDMSVGMDYLCEDVNQTIVLYQVDLDKSNLSSTYGETREKAVVTKPPVEIHCLYEIEEAQLKDYDRTKNMGTHVQTGKLKFGTYQKFLDEVGAEIRNGDYVGVQVTPRHMEYFTVVNDGRNNYDNKKSIYGYMPGWRNIECAPVDSNEFDGR